LNGTARMRHSYSPRPAAWLLAGLLLGGTVYAQDQDRDPAGDPALWPPVDIVLVWVGDREHAPAPVPEPQPATTATPVPAAAPALDLDGLENRLRETKALGLFTKLELKNQVGDLVEQIDDYHRHRSDLSLDDLEQRFDLLLLKLLVLLQDKDPKLHRDIADARPVLWATLSDPEQFATVKGP